MNLKKILGFALSFWPVLAGGAGTLLALPIFGWEAFGGVALGNILSLGTYRYQSGEWPWLGPRYQG